MRVSSTSRSAQALGARHGPIRPPLNVLRLGVLMAFVAFLAVAATGNAGTAALVFWSVVAGAIVAGVVSIYLSPLIHARHPVRSRVDLLADLVAESSRHEQDRRQRELVSDVASLLFDLRAHSDLRRSRWQCRPTSLRDSEALLLRTLAEARIEQASAGATRLSEASSQSPQNLLVIESMKQVLREFNSGLKTPDELASIASLIPLWLDLVDAGADEDDAELIELTLRLRDTLSL